MTTTWKKFIWSLVGAGVLIAGLSACSEDSGPDDGDGAATGIQEGARVLGGEEKLNAMRTYLPWIDLMTVLDIAARTSVPESDIGLDWEKGRLLIRELRTNCKETQQSASPWVTGLEMDASLALEPEADKTCPITFQQVVTAQMQTAPGEKQVSTDMTYRYEARSEQGRSLSDVQSLNLKGHGSKTVRILEDGRHTTEYLETYEGVLQSARSGHLDVRIQLEKTGTWKDGESEIVATRIRTLKSPTATFEWKIVRTYKNRKQIQALYSLNGEPLGESEYLDLVGKATARP